MLLGFSEFNAASGNQSMAVAMGCPCYVGMAPELLNEVHSKLLCHEV
jgi:hypothetical protein